MTKSVLFSLALILCAIFCVSAQDCQVALAQTDKASWTLGENCYSIVYVSITNNGTGNVNSVTLTSDSNFVAVWDMNETEWGTFVLPGWRAASTITPGQSHIFGYIILSSDEESLTLSNVGCAAAAGNSTSAPTTAPTTAPTDAPTQAPTHAATQAPTHAATSAPTQPATQAPTQASGHHNTQAPTQAPTQHATQPATHAPTQPATQAPTHAPTSAPTSAPTQHGGHSSSSGSSSTPAPTSKPTTAPTTAPTSKPTSKPTTAPATNGRLCPAGQIWSPAPLMTWQLQLTGNINTNPGVQFIDIDMFDNDASTIAALHRNGVAVSCYFSSQYEDWRPDSNQFTSDILGAALDDWPGENWVDIRSSKLRSILTARMDIAVSKGCDAIDIDNVDEYQAANGLGLTAADQLDFNKYLAQQAHNRGLSVGLKNDLDQITSLVSYFDWSLNEQCNEYSECQYLTPFVTAGKAVFGVEYDLTVSQFCSKMKTDKFSFLKKTLDLDSTGTQCCTSTGGCTGASYTCVSPNQRRALYDEEAFSRAARSDHHGHQTEAPTQAPTRHPTQAPTSRATQAPNTQAPTQRATQAPTQRATSAPTTAPTSKATAAPTAKATAAPTAKATAAPTAKATAAPTAKATAAPTAKATAAPTSKATSAPTNGRLCPAGQIWSPQPGMTWQLQLTGTINTNPGVQFIDIDMFDNDASTIAALHRNGVAVSCYFSSQYEDWRPDSAQFTSNILGAALDDWPGENWVDIRSSKLRSILTARMDIAVSKGCDAIDIDNVDEYQAANGLGLTAADQLDFNKYLAQQAHARGLSVGLKNDLDQITSLVSYFDWSLNEQCNEYSECSKLTPFVTAGKAVFGVEYDLSASQFCPAMKTAKFSFLKKTLDLDASGTQCCTSTGGCTGASYTCVSPAAKRALYEENITEEEPITQEEPTKEAPAPKKSSSSSSSLVVPAVLVFAAVALAL